MGSGSSTSLQPPDEKKQIFFHVFFRLTISEEIIRHKKFKEQQGILVP